MDGRIIILEERILRNLQKDWTIKELADSIDVSESHLQCLFKKNAKLSPIKFIQNLRYEKARELLEGRTFLRIQEVCQEVGIKDQTHFTRNFKKKYGKTPTQYRKDFWNNYAPENENENG